MEEVERFDSKTGGGSIWPCGRGCIMERRRKRRSMWWPGSWGIEGTDAADLFQTVGIHVITDAYVHTEQGMCTFLLPFFLCYQSSFVLQEIEVDYYALIW